jgi:hypothetical protein
MKLYRLITAGLASGCLVSGQLIAEEIILIEDEQEEIIVVDENEGDAEISIEQEEILIGSDDGEISIGGDDEQIIMESQETIDSDMEAIASSEQQTFSIGIDRAWLEYSLLTEDNQGVDSLSSGHVAIKAEWKPGNEWQGQLEARVDGYSQDGNPSWHDVDLDYGDNWIRYSGDNTRITVGTQTVIWGRIDEIPPSDRLSTIDGNRLNLDDLQDRRRSRPAMRVEAFGADSKLDFIYMPTFREAELADVKSIWYPIDRARGKVLGIEVPAVMALTMGTARIIDDAPDTDNAVGLRFSSNYEGIEYALTAQHGRQTMPYFTYSVVPVPTFTAQYPRSTALGGDFAFENEGANWAVGMEFYPGDADIRVNLQLAGNHLFEDNLLERENIYNVNGSIEIPFAEERWRANIRFFAGLDEKDIYFNPEIAFVDWEPHELYIEAHYFDGADGTLGGFHEDHSIISAGWRASF